MTTLDTMQTFYDFLGSEITGARNLKGGPNLNIIGTSWHTNHCGILKLANFMFAEIIISDFSNNSIYVIIFRNPYQG